MKFNYQHDYWLKIMKLTSLAVILATATLTFSYAYNTSGQDVLEERISLQAKNEPLKDVLKKIQKQTGVNFMYQNSDLNTKQRVTLSADKTELKNVLSTLLRPLGLSFSVFEKNILIKPTAKKTETKADASETTVSGTITASDTNEPLPGVNVLIKGTTRGTTTDSDGKFTLDVPSEESILVFSFIGYRAQEVVVGTTTSFSIKMDLDILQLQDIVVVGYGEIKKSEVLGAVSTVDLKESTSRNFNTAAELLQGTVPGVTVLNNGGDPTSTPEVKIRGIGTLNNESALIILDGVIYHGGYSSINPNDIESISVLKDAASAAIYGARASGGVILITTKKGALNKSNIEISYQQGMQQVAKKLEALTAAERADVYNRAADMAGILRNPAFDATINPESRVTKTIWMDEIFQTGKISNLDVSASGGNEKSNFYLAGGYRKNEGILLNTWSEQFNARINSSHEVLKGVKIGENISFSAWNGQSPNTSSSYTGAIVSALYYPANATVYREDDPTKFSGVPENYISAYGDVINPVAYLKRLDSKAPTKTLLINPYLEWEIIKGLNFRSNWAFTHWSRDEKRFTVRVLEPGKIFDSNDLVQKSDNNKRFLTEQTLTYDKTFAEKHNVTVLGGFTHERSKSEYFEVRGTNFDNEDSQYRYLKNAKNPLEILDSGGPEERIVSLIGRVNYNFDGKYLLTAVVRRDGTSRLTGSNRYETYPSVSVGWNIAAENFMQNVNFLSDLKLRASWGVIGNLGDVPLYSGNIPLARTTSLIGDDPAFVTGYAVGGISNTTLEWESSSQNNIGLDFGLLQGRLYGTFDVFKKVNKGMLFRVKYQGLTGIDYIDVNGGDVENKGMELGLTYLKREGQFTYDVTANIGSVRNNVNYVYNGQDYVFRSEFVRTTLPESNIHKVGSPAHSFYGYKTAGIFQSDAEAAAYVNDAGTPMQVNARAGDFKYVDTDGDGDIDDNDRVILGKAFPDMTFSLNGNVAFKGFDLNLFFQGVSGNSVFNAVKAVAMSPSNNYSMLADAKNAWTPENPNTDIPRIAYNEANGNWTKVSDYFIEDASFLRLKNVTLGYTLNENLFKSVKLRLYVTAQNLFTITKYSGMDPEVGMGGNGNNLGVDVGKYPLSKVYMAGISLKF